MDKNTQNLTKRAQQVIDAFGGPYKLAQQIGLTDWAVRKWYYSKIPPQRAAELELLSEGRFTKEYLRPDYFKSFIPLNS